ncbi:unnamed protein product [Effrenium voratum]|uniref:Uncharacterized protein n=1 Tax=Effrenium voratum TaxID=2562239 RepID=A0AA36IDW8_9DINO|nr:unnamed protein product [Effrenium voratum]
MVAKYPQKALSVAKQILGYLKNTDDVGIIYQKRMEPRDEEAEFPGPRSMGTLEIQADVMVMYGGGTIAWESTRQAFTTLSTAEAELTGYVQATAIGEAVATLVELLEGSKVKKMILGDNAAAISIITTPACAWRSRHLRCRAGRLAELIEEEEWRLRHLPGTLLADGLTKPLAKIQFEKCRGGMGLEVIERKKVKKAFGEKVIEKVGAAGWLAVDKLKAVVGMLSLVAVAKAEDGEEPELEGVSLEVILTVIAILVVVIWELTKKVNLLGVFKGACGGLMSICEDVKEEETQPRGSSCTARAGKVVLGEDKAVLKILCLATHDASGPEEVYVDVRAKQKPERTDEVLQTCCRATIELLARHGHSSKVRLETYEPSLQFTAE